MTPPPPPPGNITEDDLLDAAGPAPGSELTSDDILNSAPKPGPIKRTVDAAVDTAMSVRAFLAGGGLMGAAERNGSKLTTDAMGNPQLEAGPTPAPPAPAPPTASEEGWASILANKPLPPIQGVLEGAVAAQKDALGGVTAKMDALGGEAKALGAEHDELKRLRDRFDTIKPNAAEARDFNNRARALSTRIEAFQKNIDALTPEARTVLMRAHNELMPYVGGVPLPYLPTTGPLGVMLSPVPEWNMRTASRDLARSGGGPAVSSQSPQEYRQAERLTPQLEAEEQQAKPLRERKNLNPVDQALVAADDKLREAMGPAYAAIEVPIRRIFTGATSAGPGYLARAATHAADEALGGMMWGGEKAGGRLRGDQPDMAGRVVEGAIGFLTEWPLIKASAALSEPFLKLALDGVAGRIYRSILDAPNNHLSPAVARILAHQAVGNTAAVERLAAAQRASYLATAAEAGYVGAEAEAVANEGMRILVGAIDSVRPDRVASILSHVLPGASAVALTDSMREASRQLADHGTITDKGAIAVEGLTGAALGATVGAVSGAIERPVLQQLANLGGYALLGPVIKHGQAPTVEDALNAGVPAVLIYAATKLAAARARGGVEILGPEEGPFGRRPGEGPVPTDDGLHVRPQPGIGPGEEPEGAPQGPIGPQGGPPGSAPRAPRPTDLERIRLANETLEQAEQRLDAMEPQARNLLMTVVQEWGRLKEREPELQAWEDKENLARTKREARTALAEAPPVVKLNDQELGQAIHDEFQKIMEGELEAGTPAYAEMARALSTQEPGEEPPAPAAEPEAPKPKAPVFPTVPDRLQPAAQTAEAKDLRPVTTAEDSRRLVDDLSNAGYGASIDVMDAAGEVHRWTKDTSGQWTRPDNPGALEPSSGVAHGAQGRGDLIRPVRAAPPASAPRAPEPAPDAPEAAPRATPEPAEEKVTQAAQDAYDELKTIFEGESKPKAEEPPKKEPEPATAPELAESSPVEAPAKAESRPAEAEPPKAPAKAEEPAPGSAEIPKVEYAKGDRVQAMWGEKGSIVARSGTGWIVKPDGGGKTHKIDADALRREEPGPKFEKTPIGEQAVVPGAGGRAMPHTPLKPTVAQKEPGGLFKPPAEKKDQQPELPVATEPAAVTPEPHASAEPHKFSSTQIELPTEIANDIIRWAREHIDPKDLAEEGIEQHPHVTVKYGIHTNDLADIEPLVSGEGPIKVQLGPMSKFGGSESDVLHIAVQSPALHRLNAKISKGTKVTDTFPDYRPHATVAYLKPGKAIKYVSGTMGHSGLEGREFTADRISFMPKDGEPTSIPLGTIPVEDTPAETTPSKGSPAEGRPARPVRQPYDRETAQKTYSAFKGALTKQVNVGDPINILTEVRRFNAHYLDSPEPMPDDWSRWQRAADDAAGKILREGGQDLHLEVGRPNPPWPKKPVTPQIVPGRKPPAPAPVPLGGEVETFTPKDPEQLARFVRAAGGLKADREGGADYDLSLVPLRFRNNNGITVAHMAEGIAEAWGQPYEEGDLLRDLTRLETTRRQQQETRRPSDAHPEEVPAPAADNLIRAEPERILAGMREKNAVALDIMAAVHEAVDAAGDLESALDMAAVVPKDAIFTSPGGRDIPRDTFVKLLESLRAPSAAPVSAGAQDAATELRGVLGTEAPDAFHEEAPRYGPADVKKISLLIKYGRERYAQGLKDFDKWSARMHADFGPAVEPYVRPAFDRIVEQAGAAAPPAPAENPMFPVGSKVIRTTQPAIIGEVIPGGGVGSVAAKWPDGSQSVTPAVSLAPAPGSTIEPAPQEAANGTATRPAGPEHPRPLEEAPAPDVPRAGTVAPPEGVAPGSGGASEPGAVQPDGRGDGVRPGVGDRPGGSVLPGRGAAPRVGIRPDERPTASHDYRITDASAIGVGGPQGKARGNLEAIRLLKAIEGASRPATPEEQAILAKYVGWGAIAQPFDKVVRREFQGIRAELDLLLTPEEFRLAAGSTPNAHYTSPMVIRGMWDAMARLGVPAGSQILEPSMGVGHFFGLMPEAMLPNSRRVGVELDSITGRIAKLLYPHAQVYVSGFEQVRMPDNFFDVAIGNVPFGDYGVADPKYRNQPSLTRAIHDYFFAKAMDKIRPGGIVAFITSSYTMDKSDTWVRKYLGDRADLLGAIRLPNTTFKGNAGTEVTTDIIFLQKRAPGAKRGGEDWTALKSITGAKGDPMFVNEYYQAHPQMMLGRMNTTGTMYAQGQPTLEGELTPDRLAAAVAKLPAGAFKPWEAPQPEGIIEVPTTSTVKENAFSVKDGQIVVRRGSLMVPTGIVGKPAERIKGMIAVRDAAREVFRSQLEDRPDPELATARTKLGRAYDNYVRRLGFLNERGNRLAFSGDPDLPLLLSLENWDPDSETATKADVFTKRTLQKYVPPDHVGTADEALAVSLNELGRLDWQRMQELTGRTPDELQAELGDMVYRNPEGGAWEPRDQYLSGDVRDKLQTAEMAATTDPTFRRNAEALKAVQPEDIPRHQIAARLGASWIPPSDVAAFVGHILDIRPDAVTARYIEPTATWYVDMRNPRHPALEGIRNLGEWGIPRYPALDLIIDALNLKSPIVWDQLDDDKRVVNQVLTAAAKDKQSQVRDEFIKWLWSDDERATRLSRKYNDERNNIRLRVFDGSYLKFPGMARLTLRNQDLYQHQKNFVARAIQSGNALAAHVVGAGKTFSLAAAIMEMRRLGLARKPMVVVPNHLVEQWAGEWLRLYPAANLLVAGKEHFEKDKRERIIARIATGNYDAVIVAHSSFGRIRVSDETFNAFLQEQIDELVDHIRTEREAQGKNARSVKDMEKAKKRLEAKLRKKGDQENKDKALTFEELGVDHVAVDEFHLFKNLFFSTKMTRVAGVSNSDAGRAFDMFVKTQYVVKRNGGRRGVLGATGTPISNTISEAYTMQRFFQMEALRAAGLAHFDAWAQEYGDIINAYEIAPEGPQKMRVAARFAQFTNVPELQQLFRQVTDVQTAEMLNLPTPRLAGGKPEVVSAPPSAALKSYQEQLGQRAAAIRSGKVDRREDNMLKVTTDGRKAALDIRLVVPTAPEDPNSKVNIAARRIHDFWQKGTPDKLSQVVFLDLGTPTRKKKKPKRVVNPEEEEQDRLDREREAELIAAQNHVYGQLRDKLVAMGIPRAEIAFMQEAKGDAAKKKLFNAVNAGTVRVLLGSTPTLGVGANIQRRLVTLHHLDQPWKPAEIEQREGRLLRQGNENEEVHILRYVTEGSFDAYMWQTLARKASAINPFMKGDITVRTIEDVDGAALTASEAMAIASGSPLVMEKVKVDAEIRRYDALRAAYLTGQADLRSRLREAPGRIERTKLAAERYRQDMAQRDAALAANPDFAITIGGDVVEGEKARERAGAKLLQVMADRRGKSGIVEVGSYLGFPLAVQGYGNREFWPMLFLKGQVSHEVSVNPINMTGTIMSMESVLRHMDAKEAERRGRAASFEKDLADSQGRAEKPFEHEDKLRTLLERQKQINASLDLNKSDAQAGEQDAADDGDDEGGDDDDTPDSLREDTAPYRPTGTEGGREAAKMLVHSVDITPAMKASVLGEGQALFDKTAPYGWDKVGPGETAPARYTYRRDGNAKAREAREGALRDLGRFPELPDPGRALGVSGPAIRTRTLAHGFSPERIHAELLRTGTVNLRGQVVHTAQDLATIAQVLRDPRYETLRYFYTKDGVIVGQEAVTSRLPSVVVPWFKGADVVEFERMRDTMRALGADGFWMLHNHPSGHAQPSVQDVQLTQKFRENIPGFKGHVVIDSGEYGTIDGNLGTTFKLEAGADVDELLVPSMPHAMYRASLLEPKEVARVGAALKTPTGWAVVLYRDGSGFVRGIQETPIVDLMRADAGAWLQDQKRAFGAPEVFIYTPRPEDLLERPVRALMDAGHITDYVDSADRSLMARQGSGIMYGDRFGEPAAPHRVEEPQPMSMRSTFVPRAEADRIAERLRAQGHEVEVRPVGPLASVWSRPAGAAPAPPPAAAPGAGGAGVPPVTPPPAPPADAEPPLPPRPTPAQAARLRDDVRSLLAPATANPAAAQQGLIMREKLADFALKQERAREALKAAQKAFDAMPGDERERFLRIADAIEEGTILDLPDSVRPIAEAIRELTDQRSMQLRDRELVRHFIENYFGHIWKDPRGTLTGADIGARFIGRRPLAGPESFRKHRTIPTYREGVELGLEPVSWNPVTIALLKLREMDKSIMGRDIFTEMKDQGLAVFVRFGQPAPEGWTKIDDKIARVLQYSEEERGFVLRGDYYAPEGAAKVLHNYLNPGLAGNAIYDVLRGVGNLMNQAQLGFSFFHLGFVTMDVQTSAFALGLQQLAAGQPIRAARSLLLGTVPLAGPIAAFTEGSKVLHAALQAPGTVGGQMGEILEALVRSGGRIRMEARNVHGEQVYKNDSIQAWLQALRTVKKGEAGWKDWGRTVFGTFPAALEAVAWPTMEVMVPRMKLGVFARLALHELEKLGPGARMADVPGEALARVWDAVDDRLGQLVYDNLFWSRTLKDALQLSTRSVGWNLGDVRNVGGPAVGRLVGMTLGALLAGPPGAFYGAGAGYMAGAVAVEAPGQVRRLRAGQGVEMTPKLSYAMALVAVTAIFGAMYQFLMTGEGPQEPQDYFYPRTGGERPDGSADRVSLPGYMKDVNSFGHAPWQTMKHKLHPLIGTVSQLLENEDFYGRAIRDPQDPLTTQAIDLGDYLLRQFESFSFRAAQQQAEVSDDRWRWGQGFVGITPAPAWTTRETEQQDAIERKAFKRQLDKKHKNDRINPGVLRGVLEED